MSNASVYVLALEPTSVRVPVVANDTSSLLTSPLTEPADVRGMPLYTLLASGVLTVRVLGVILTEPEVKVTASASVLELSLFTVTSPLTFLNTTVPFSFLMVISLQYAVTVPSAT